MTAVGAWEGFAWVNEPVRTEIDALGRLRWETRPVSDFWRHTGGVVGADYGDALLVGCEGDFKVTMQLQCEFLSPFDQCGLMVRVDERNWLKAGIELDGSPWFSVVETREHSDWSKQAISTWSVEFTLCRANATRSAKPRPRRAASRCGVRTSSIGERLGMPRFVAAPQICG